MIRSFRNRALRQLFEGKPKGIEADLGEKVENILAFLQSADSPQAMNLPGFGQHALRGDRREPVVNKNWRITFRLERGNACDVDFEDYHLPCARLKL